MDVRLPSGVVIRGVPEGTSKEEIKQKAIAAGLATESDFGEAVESAPVDENVEASYFDKVKASAVDMLPELAGLSGAAGGAALGLPFGPAGAVIGGAIGAFSGAGAGEAGRQLITGEAGSFADIGTWQTDPEKLAQVVGVASKEGILDITGAKAIDIIVGAGKLAGKLLPSAKPVDDATRELQQELRARGTTLRATQIRPDSAVIEGVESAAEGGIGNRGIYQKLADSHQAYIDDQIDALIKAQSRLSTEQTGDLMHNLIENTRVASGEAYGKVFDALQEAGKGVNISIQGIRNFAQQGRYEAMEGLTKSAREIAKRGGKVPFLDGQIKGAYDDILSLTPNMDFATAFKKLKSLKNRLTALRGDPATANNPAVAELTGIVKNFEEQMLKQAGKANPELVEQYTKAMTDYSKTQRTLFNDTMLEALKKDPELVARTLLAPGRTTPIKDIKRLVAEAKKLKKSGELTGTVSDPLNGLRRSFLEGALSGQGGMGIEQVRGLESKLANPEFRRTFEALFDPQTVGRIDKLIKQAQILSRGPGGELALSIRSRQASAAESVIRPDRSLTQKLIGTVVAMTPSLLTKAVTDPQKMDRLANLMTVVIKAQNEDKRIPPAAVRGILVLIGDAAVDIEGDRRNADVEALMQEYGVQQQQRLSPTQATQAPESSMSQEERLRQEAGL
jgi:hypothetical protein